MLYIGMQIILAFLLISILSVTSAQAFDVDSYTEQKQREAFASRKNSEKAINLMRYQVSQGKPIIISIASKINPTREKKPSKTEAYSFDQIETASGKEENTNVTNNDSKKIPKTKAKDTPITATAPEIDNRWDDLEGGF